MCTNIGNNLFRGHTHTESTEHLRTYTVMQNRGGAGRWRGGGGEQIWPHATTITTTFQKRNKSETGTINGEWTGLGWGGGTYSFVHSTPHFLFPTPETQVPICCQTSEQFVCSYKQGLCQGVNENKNPVPINFRICFCLCVSLHFLSTLSLQSFSS